MDTDDFRTQHEASKPTRFANMVIDYFGMLFVAFLLILAGAELVPDFIDNGRGFFQQLVLTALAYLLYYIPFEGLCGRTPGKWITGTRVVNQFGKKASMAQIIQRTLARLIPFEWLSYFGETRKGWHDTMSDTMVIKIA